MPGSALYNGRIVGGFVDSTTAVTVTLPSNPMIELGGGPSITTNVCYPTIAPPASPTPFPVGVNLGQRGGGTWEIKVSGMYAMTTAGAAEAWFHKVLTDLGATTQGDLYINLQHWRNATFVQGSVTLTPAFEQTIGHYQLTFLSSAVKEVESIENTAMFPNPQIFVPPGTYTNAADYLYSGRPGYSGNIGAHCFVEKIAVSRDALVTDIPRGTGVRVKPVRGGRKVSLIMKAWLRSTAPTRENLELQMFGLIKQIGAQKVSLIGQGNTFEDCYLTSYSTDSGESTLTSAVSLTFAQQFEAPSVT